MPIDQTTRPGPELAPALPQARGAPRAGGGRRPGGRGQGGRPGRHRRRPRGGGAGGAPGDRRPRRPGRAAPLPPRDLDGAWLAVAAAPPEVNRAVGVEAERRRVFVNAVDDPRAATAYAGGVIRRGGVTVAISTDGRAPALAGLLREGIEALLPEQVGAWVERAEALRAGWRAEGVRAGRPAAAAPARRSTSSTAARWPAPGGAAPAPGRAPRGRPRRAASSPSSAPARAIPSSSR